MSSQSPLSQEFRPAPGERFRLEHRVDPRSGPFGESSTVIRHGKDVTVDHVAASGQARRFHATLASGVYERIVEALKQAGFPDAPREKLGPDGSRLVSTIAQGHELRTRPMPYRTAAPGWSAAFALFDAVIAETTAGLAAPSEAVTRGMVTGAAELAVFTPSQEADEPPLGEDANDVVAGAWKLAIARKHHEVTSAHLLAAFAAEHGYQLSRLGLDQDAVLTAAEALFSWDPEPAEPVSTPGFELVPQVARRIAADDGAKEASLRHLLRAMLEAGGRDVIRVLQRHRLPDALLAGRTRERIFAPPEASPGRACARCGTAYADTRWCTHCGRALTAPNLFSTGNALERALPLLRPHDWPSRASAVVRALCTPEAGAPLLCFQLEGEARTELVTAAQLGELGVDAKALEDSAIRNLARAPASWTPRWVPDSSGREVDVLFCEDDHHASERILEKPFLLHAQAMLGVKALAAAVPRRGLLLVTRIQDLAVLMALCRHYHDNAEADALSAWGFVVQDGEISGPISSP